MKPFFVLLLPVVLILCGVASAPAQEPLPKAQADAVAAIKINLLGGRVKFDTTDAVVEVEIRIGAKITDVELKHLEKFTSLKKLTIHSSKITDAGLMHLKGLL